MDARSKKKAMISIDTESLKRRDRMFWISKCVEQSDVVSNSNDLKVLAS